MQTSHIQGSALVEVLVLALISVIAIASLQQQLTTSLRYLYQSQSEIDAGNWFLSVRASNAADYLLPSTNFAYEPLVLDERRYAVVHWNAAGLSRTWQVELP